MVIGFTARTAEEIRDAMVAVIMADARIYDIAETDPTKLSNPSNASIWYNLLNTFAVEINILETLMEDLIVDLDNRALEIPVGTSKWYAAETLEYQYGDSLILVDGVPQYPIDDPTKKVAEVSASVVENGINIIKAAKLDGNGNPIPLDTPEYDGLVTYWIQKRMAGTGITVISQAGDDMIVYATIEVDGQKISTTGQSQSNLLIYPVEVAIKNYYKQLDFNGRFLVMKLVDAIQAVDGVENVKITQVLAKQYTETEYVNVLSTDSNDYTAVSGYIVEDATGLLTDTLTYI